jgi:hypothetical protein
MNTHKTCNCCRATLSIDEFYNCCHTRDRLQGRCKTCSKNYQLERQRRKRTEWNQYFAKYARKRRATDPGYRLTQNIRSAINYYLRTGGAAKSQQSERLLGCTFERYMRYIESKFAPGMTWDMVGKEIHIDHIRPLSSFDLTDPIQQRQAFHYTNTQPLWAADNLRKHARWENPK